jgi:hypothetical protein
MTARKGFYKECRLEVWHPEVMELERPSGASAARADLTLDTLILQEAAQGHC